MAAFRACDRILLVQSSLFVRARRSKVRLLQPTDLELLQIDLLEIAVLCPVPKEAQWQNLRLVVEMKKPRYVRLLMLWMTALEEQRMWKISMYDPEYKRIRQDAEALSFGQTPKFSSVKMERLIKAVAAAIKVERAAGAVVETKKKAEEEARSHTEEAMNEFFAATKVTDD